MKQTVTVRVTKEIEVCERCKKPREREAQLLTVESTWFNKPVQKMVCADCATIILHATMPRKRKTKRPETKQPEA